MGAQNTKERTVSVGTHSVRANRNRPRVKDGRQITSNIFTEHNGMNHLIAYLHLCTFRRLLFNNY